jgi:hypothetical protein
MVADTNVRQPVILYAFTGWNDAGEAASSALRLLVEQWDATKVGSIDAEPFTDFATVRPFVVIEDGRRHVIWPTVDVWTVSLPATDAVLITGPEPALRWRLFTEQFIGLADRLGASMAIALGALLAEYPHRRPTHLTATSTDESLLHRFNLSRPTYEGPTGIVGVLSDALTTAGVPTVSLWAAVPTYTAQIPAAKASAALARRACSMIDTPPPADVLAAAVAEYETQVAALLEDDKLAAYVHQLEQVMPLDADEASDDDVTTRFDLDVDDQRLVAEVEQFLRDKDDS